MDILDVQVHAPPPQLGRQPPPETGAAWWCTLESSVNDVRKNKNMCSTWYMGFHTLLLPPTAEHEGVDKCGKTEHFYSCFDQFGQLLVDDHHDQIYKCLNFFLNRSALYLDT